MTPFYWDGENFVLERNTKEFLFPTFRLIVARIYGLRRKEARERDFWSDI